MNRYHVPYIPGASTLKEVIEGMECDADMVKVSPAETLGPAFVKAVRGLLPKTSLMPTGGVSLENVGEWIQAGCVAWVWAEVKRLEQRRATSNPSLRCRGSLLPGSAARVTYLDECVSVRQ